MTTTAVQATAGWRTTSSISSMPTGAPRTTSASGRSTCLDNPLLREPLEPEHVKPRPAGSLRDGARAQPDLRPPEPRHSRRATSTRCTSTGPGHGGPGLVGERLPRGHLYRGLSDRDARCRRHGTAVPPVQLSRAVSRATSRPRRLAPSTRGASWATRWSHAYGAAFDNPDLLVAASSVTARPRPDRWPRAGTRTSSSTPVRTVSCLPILHLNGYKIAESDRLGADPETTSSVSLFAGYGHSVQFVAGDDPADVHRRLCGDARSPPWTRSPTIQRAREIGGTRATTSARAGR